MAVEAVADLHERCMNDVADIVKALDLSAGGPPGNVKDRVYVQPLPDTGGLRYPLVLVTIEGLTEEELDGTFESEEVAFPVQVLILDREPILAHQPIYLKWRQQIARHFRRKVVQLPSASEVYDTRVSPNLVLDREAALYKLIRTGLTIRCLAQYARQSDEE